MDGRATGANNGTSWADAWTTLTNSSVASSLSAGDTLWISGGTTGQVYYGNVSFNGNHGTPASPIKIKTAQAAGHTGKVTLYGTLTLSRSNYWVEGSKTDSHAVTNTIQVWSMATNVNWKISGWFSNALLTIKDTPLTFYNAGCLGGQARWLELTHQGITTNDSTHDLYQAYAGLIFKVDPSSNPMVSNVCDHIWIHNTSFNGVSVFASAAAAWDKIDFGYFLQQTNGQDYWEAKSGSGWNVHHSIVHGTDSAWVIGGGWRHQDGVVPGAARHRLYNNILFDTGDTLGFYPAINADFGGDYYIYGNLFFVKDWPDTDSIDSQVGFYTEDGWSGTSQTWSNIHVYNNTFVVTNGTFHAWAMGNAKYPSATVWLTNFYFMNNVLYGAQQLGQSLAGFSHENMDNVEGAVVIDWNVFSGTTSTQAKFSALTNGVEGTFTAEEFNAASAYAFTNTSIKPVFADFAAFDFRLGASDTACKDTGTNLATVMSGWPGAGHDLAGTPRGMGGAWDRGAFEYTNSSSYLTFPADTNKLLLWLTFEGGANPADGRFDDMSGNGRHLLRPSWFSNSALNTSIAFTNWPLRVSATNRTGYAGRFSSAYDALYTNQQAGSHLGDYGMVTNQFDALLNMTQATVAVWAWFFNARDCTPGNTHTATLLDAGYDEPGTWSLSRNYSDEVRFSLWTNSGAQPQAIYFPEAVEANCMNTTNWHHYAVTVDCAAGTVIGYYNGVPFQTNALPAGVTRLTAHTNGGAFKWIAVGCQTHTGNPWLAKDWQTNPAGDDGYPNNGWFDGMMDDVRIYGRALSAAEVAVLADSTPAEPPPSEGGSRTGRATLLRVGRVRSP